MTDQLSIPEINSLWDKVSCRMESCGQTSELPAETRQLDPLSGILSVEGDMALRYEILCRRIGNNRKTADLAAKLYENQLGLVKRLAAAVFLRSCQRPALSLFEKPSGELMEQLREYALWELNQAEAYAKYGPSAEPSLRDILCDGQRRKEKNAALLSEIIGEYVLVSDTYRRAPPSCRR